MSRLSPSILPLDKGLNLQTAKILAPAGTLLDSLNYEQVDFQGQKRIDGYARYDGSVLPAFDDFAMVPNNTTRNARGVVFNGEGVPFGQYLADRVGPFGATFYVVAIFNERAMPYTALWGRDVIEDVEDHYEAVLQYTAILRSIIEYLPGAIAGLHWFRDRLYAVADMGLVTVSGTPDILPNDTVTDQSGTVYSVMQPYSEADKTYIMLPTTSVAGITSLTVTRTGATLAVTGVQAGVAASFFESRTEAQVLEEDGAGATDYGWRFKHLGWAVPFDEGTSPFGDLVSLNQNRQGVGIQGPTSIAGDNGRPLVLVQNVNITNKPTQVNGWKTSTSPTVYSLEASALQDVDTTNIYADMFISWAADSATPVAPGADGNNLVEYSPTSTVVVDV